MVAVGEIKNKVLSKFQSRVHSHLQGLKIERTHPRTSIFSISTRSARCLPCVTGETVLEQTLLSDIYTMYSGYVNLFISNSLSCKWRELNNTPGITL
jgi:hypothetical protein